MVSPREKETIVVSGIAGRFPNANNVSEFSQKLFNKVDLTDEDESRWKHFHSEVPKRTGKIRNLEKFDASFFSILDKHANLMDPQARCLLEHCYEAILDAGMSPQSLFGSKTGVFIGCCCSESREAFSYQLPVKDGLMISGNAIFYLANKISYVFGLSGPSMVVDTACSSSAYALNSAYKAIMSGECDAALVAGAQLSLTLGTNVEYSRLRILAPDGEFCRPFDEKATGFIRADTISVILLQRSKDSKRVYAELVHTQSNNDGYKKEGPSLPSRIMQQKLMEDFFEQSKFDPTLINFVEAHSTGTRLGDPEEIAAIDAVYCKNKNRKRPLAVGSVKSNMGHAEASSAMASIAKVIFALETQKIPPNINITSVRSDIEAFAEKRIRVVTEVEKLNGPYISMNSFGLGGANVHILFRGNEKEKINHGIPNDDLNRVVLWSGRTENAVHAIFDDITKRPLDGEHIALLQNSQIKTNPGNTYRGYGIFRHDEEIKKAVCLQRDVQYLNDGESRKMVWVFSGIGSQWAGMGADLMKIPICAESINHCHGILIKKGIDLKQILTSKDKTLFSNVLNSYVGIIAIEIALTKLLRALGLSPDFIIGHSAGEMACAYADGCWTENETILAAYARGVASNQSMHIEGAMAAVGLNFKDVEKTLPSSIDIACHNGIDSTTISGPVKDVRKYVQELKEQNIFAKEVESSGNPMHSRYITEMGKNLLLRLREVIKNPKKRSEKWLSSSYPEEMWNTPESQFSSAEYHTKNLLNPVLFEEVTNMLPKNVITIEIAPHGLLKSILKRSLKDGIHFSLTQRDSADGAHLLMETFGKLFQSGVDLDIGKLYPAIEFPVSRGTPMISSNIEWNHSQKYFIPHFDTFHTYERRNLIININDKNFEFVQGHIIDGKVLFPGTGWIHLVWETFANMHGVPQSKFKVIFEDVRFLRATSLVKNQDVLVTINIHRGTGRFEIIEGKSAIANGMIKVGENIVMTEISVEDKKDSITMKEQDFYKEMKLRGYYHQGLFRAIKEIRDDGLKGLIKWNDEWTTFLDCLIQCMVVAKDTRMLMLPTSVRKIIIDPIAHQNFVASKKEDEEILFDVRACHYMRIVQTEGVEIQGFEGSLVNRRKPVSDPVLEFSKFIPFKCDEILSKLDVAKICVQLYLENSPGKKFVSVELDSGDESEVLSENIFDALADLPVITPEVHFLTSKEIKLENVSVHEDEISSLQNANFIVRKNCIGDQEFLESARSSLHENGFFISIENERKVSKDLDLISILRTENSFIHVMRAKKSQATSSVLKITQNVNEWLQPLKDALVKDPSVIAYSQNDPLSGIVGLFNCIRREPNGEKLRCVFVNDQSAPVFDPLNDFYKSQLELGLIVNIYQDGAWGTFRHLKIDKKYEEKTRIEHCYANCLIKGDLSTLTWLYGPLNENKPKEMLNICYSSLNFRDVMLATGKLSADDVLDRIKQQTFFGFEFSGILNGKRVMGMGATGAMATHYDVKHTLLWDVPDYWNLEDAASIPLAYYTAYLAFFRKIHITKGNSILIHAGCGGVGLAAIQVALSYGLEVFTTVSTVEKRNHLLSTFPLLKPENIGNSRDVTFERMISLRTKGEGVDIVLNSLSEDKLQASIRCLAVNGTFIEIGKFDIHNKTNIHMGHLAKRVNITAISFDHFNFELEEFAIVRKLINDDIEAGIVKPLKVNVFDASEIEQAFRFMGSGKHIGKVLLKMRENVNDTLSLPIKMLPRVFCNSNESFIIVGGLGGFGLELADWLMLRGCRRLVLSSSRGITNAYQATRIKLWKSYGVEVIVSTANISTEAGCEQLVKQAISLGPVGGIFNLAVALCDGLFENLTEQMFIESQAPKAEATKHLDKVSRLLCPSLKHFVVFSSVSCGRGNAGQSNYGMANSVMERVCEMRHKKGLPAKAIQFGAIADVGLLAELQERNLEMEIGGTLPQKISSCLEVFDNLFTLNEPIVASMVVAEKRQDDSKKGNILDVIMGIMGIRDKKLLPMESSLSKLGIDSLMGVEILQILERDFDLVLSSQELRSITLSQLVKLVEAGNTAEDALNKSPLNIEKLLTSFGDEKTKFEIVLKLNEKSTSKKKILIIPGLEGMASDIWFDFASKLEHQTFALQLASTVHEKSLEEIFEKIKNHVLQVFKNDSSFILIGYSLGSLLALKIASFLESLGKTGKVFIIDGAPKFFYKISNILAPKDSTDDELLEVVLMASTKLLFRDSAHEVGKKIFSHQTTEARFEEFLKLGKERSEYSIEFGRAMIQGIANRLKIALNADKIEFQKLKSSTQFSLLKPSEASLHDIEDDYGLSELTESKIEIKTFDGDHVSILNNPELIQFVASNF